jgi:hypothetical protein
MTVTNALEHNPGLDFQQAHKFIGRNQILLGKFCYLPKQNKIFGVQGKLKFLITNVLRRSGLEIILYNDNLLIL